jgi:quercetin dioxygenase-like cupin family protein
MTVPEPIVHPADRAPVHHLTALEGVPLSGPVEVRERARSETMLVLEVRMPAGSASGEHRHDTDSVGYVISGRVRAWVGGVESVATAGDAFVHPRGVPHRVEALEDSHWIEIKSPPVLPFAVDA